MNPTRISAQQSALNPNRVSINRGDPEQSPGQSSSRHQQSGQLVSIGSQQVPLIVAAQMLVGNQSQSQMMFMGSSTSDFTMNEQQFDYLRDKYFKPCRKCGGVKPPRTHHCS